MALKLRVKTRSHPFSVFLLVLGSETSSKNAVSTIQCLSTSATAAPAAVPAAAAAAATTTTTAIHTHT